MEDALVELFGERVRVIGAGRTDSGVHATGQVISFTTPRLFPVERLAVALQSHLPPDVAMRDVAQVDAAFSARHSARSRTYVYAVHNAPDRSPLLARLSWHVRKPLDHAAMDSAARHFIGEHDFRSFCALPEGGSTTRRVTAFTIERHGNLVRLAISANGFLHHMVRALAGTLAECGHGRRDPSSIPAALEARDRAAAGVNAPPQGLYLAGVRYDEYDSYREPWLFARKESASTMLLLP